MWKCCQYHNQVAFVSSEIHNFKFLTNAQIQLNKLNRYRLTKYTTNIQSTANVAPIATVAFLLLLQCLDCCRRRPSKVGNSKVVSSVGHPLQLSTVYSLGNSNGVGQLNIHRCKIHAYRVELTYAKSQMQEQHWLVQKAVLLMLTKNEIVLYFQCVNLISTLMGV